MLYTCVKKDIETLNAAYTEISKSFEPTRISYGGSVFLNCYYQKADKDWYPIENIRSPFYLSALEPVL